MRRLAALALLAACSRAPAPPPAPEAAASKRDVFLFVGDSLTAGYGVAVESAFPALLEERWRREGVPFRARNAGVSGSTTAGVLENLDWSLADDVHTVFLCIGANDGLRGLDLAESRRNIERIVEKARAKGARIVLAGMKLPPNYGREYASSFESIYPAVAKELGLELMPFLLDGIGGQASMNIEDGIHPNEAGHARIAENVHRFLRERGLLKG